MSETPRESSLPGVILIAVAGVLALLLCCGGAAYLGQWWLTDEFPGEIADDVQSNPVIQEHIGVISEIRFDLTGTGNEPGDDVFVFVIRGDKGSGLLRAECVTTGSGETVRAAELILDSGERHQLFPGNPLPPTQP